MPNLKDRGLFMSPVKEPYRKEPKRDRKALSLVYLGLLDMDPRGICINSLSYLGYVLNGFCFI
jgi:hypothetical protein